MKDKNPKNRLTPEQEAELASLFMIQKKHQSRIVALFSNLISNNSIPYLIMGLLELEIPILNLLKRFAFQSAISSLKNDERFNVDHYFGIKDMLRENLDKYDSYIQDLLRTYGHKNMEQFITRLGNCNADLGPTKTSFAQFYWLFTCANVQNFENYPSLKCLFPTDSERLPIIESYSSKTLNELYSLTTRAIAELKPEIAKYNSNNFQFSGLSLSELSKYGYIYPLEFGFVFAATIAFEIFIMRPFLVKLISFFNTKHLTHQQIFSLTESQARSLIVNVKNENKKLSGLDSIYDFSNLVLPFAFLIAFAYMLSTKGFEFYWAAICVNLIIVLAKDIAVRLYQQKVGKRLDSALQKQRNLLGQISQASGQNKWTIHKGVSLDTSYLVLNIVHKTSPKELCDVIKYALLTNGINIIADGRDCIVISGNESLTQERLHRATQNIIETLGRLEKLKDLKDQFKVLAKQMNSKYNYYMKRTKNHSVVAVFEQEISSEYQDIITLEACKKIFPKHRVKIEDQKLVIIGFELLGSAFHEYRLLFAQKKMQSGFQSTSSNTSGSNHSRPSPSLKAASSISQEKATKPTQTDTRRIIKWPRNYTYDSKNPNCQIYNFFSSGKKQLFVVSELGLEDFANVDNYNHYLNKIKNSKLASVQKGQGFVKVSDLCVRDRHGNRFFASWKYRFLGARGDERPLCEELKSATGEKLLVVRAVSDHKGIERMQKTSSKTI